MKEIFIFDIDGCILPVIFPNFGDEKISRADVVKGALESGKNISLFPEFIIFYKKRCVNAEAIVFITGRKESEFAELTNLHLNPLKEIKEFRVIYYPEEKEQTSDQYFTWKVNEIQEKFKAYLDNPKDTTVIFKIYDDMTDYFDQINKIAEELEIPILLNLITGPEDWKDNAKG